MMPALILSCRRIYALIFSYITLLLRSPPRLIESVYWPLINTFLLGFLNYYIMKSRGVETFSFHTLLGATLLLEFFLRAQLSFLLCFIEEIYSRNVGQLYASPLRGVEQILAYALITLLRLTIALVPAILICWTLFGYNLFDLGVWFIPFVVNLLLTGMAFGIFLISFLLRFGQSAEWFGWMLGWAFIPFMGVYYPVSLLPAPLPLLGQILPPTHIFEALRQLAAHSSVDEMLIWKAFTLNGFYIACALLVFFRTLKGARMRGNLLNLNE